MRSPPIAVLAVVLAACATKPASPAHAVDPIAAAAAEVVAAGCARPLASPPVPTWREAPRGADAFDVVVYTAHPDDEAMYAGGTMDRLVKAGRRVAFVSASHGEGGRVLERDASGAVVTRRDYPRAHVVELRDREIEDAAKAIGVTVAHLEPADANLDYGFTESCADALRHWDAASPGGVAGILRRLVADVRARRPRVVVTLDPRDDPQASHHGHHEALGVLAELAARLAADPRAGEGTPHVVEELLTTAPRGVRGDVTVRVDVAARLAMLAAYRSQFVADELAKDETAQRPEEAFVLRWRAAGAPPVKTSRLAEMVERAS